MSRVLKLGAFALAGLLAGAGQARAAGFAVAEQSASAGGTAGAATARSGDPAAGWYNPAALADGVGLRLGLGVRLALPSVSAPATDGSGSEDAESKLSTPPTVYASWARGANAFGVAVGVPFGSGVTWPGTWPGRFEITSSRIEVARIAPFYARALTRDGKLRVAGGAHIDLGRMRIGRSLDFIDTEGSVALDLSGWGVGLDAALFWQAARGLDVGLSIKSRTTLALSGGADFEAPLAVSGKAQDQHADSELNLPDRLALGARWARGRLALLGDLEVVTWSRRAQTVIDFERDATPDVVQEDRWHSTLAVRAGAEFAPRPGWLVRGGAFLDPTPAPDDALAPSSPDSTRVGLTLGGGHSFGRVTVDGFYEYLTLLERTAQNPEALAASYGGHAHLVGISVSLLR